MPIYEYLCPKCGSFDAIQGVNDKPLKANPECLEKKCPCKAQRIMSASAFHLKGGGWYKDGYGGSAGAQSKGAGSKDAGSAGATKDRGAESSAGETKTGEAKSAEKGAGGALKVAGSEPGSGGAGKGGCGSGCKCH